MNEFIQNLLMKLSEIFQPAHLGKVFGEWVINLITGVMVSLFFYLLWLVLRRVVTSILEKNDQDETTRIFIQTLTKYSILIIGGMYALKAGGVDISAVLASLGIAGIAIGFAARDAFSNLISGLLIFLDRPFVIGDLVEVSDKYGKVDQITLRSTRIITPDGRMLAVPNTEMINKPVASYTNFPHLRLDLRFTIGLNEDIHHVRQILLDLVDQDPDFLKEPPPQVLLMALNDYNNEFELRVWIDNERMHVGKRAQLKEQVYNALHRSGVEMPYETIQLAPFEIKSETKSN
ncbi:MAG: mechanosensitive ion channel family protein [Anaerolineales bacterium]